MNKSTQKITPFLRFDNQDEDAMKDRYGVSWQIIPDALPKLLNDPDPEKSGRVMQAMLGMKKFDIESLKQAYEGELTRSE